MVNSNEAAARQDGHHVVSATIRGLRPMANGMMRFDCSSPLLSVQRPLIQTSI